MSAPISPPGWVLPSGQMLGEGADREAAVFHHDIAQSERGDFADIEMAFLAADTECIHRVVEIAWQIHLACKRLGDHGDPGTGVDKERPG